MIALLIIILYNNGINIKKCVYKSDAGSLYKGEPWGSQGIAQWAGSCIRAMS